MQFIEFIAPASGSRKVLPAIVSDTAGGLAAARQRIQTVSAESADQRAVKARSIMPPRSRSLVALPLPGALTPPARSFRWRRAAFAALLVGLALLSSFVRLSAAQQLQWPPQTCPNGYGTQQSALRCER